MASHSFVDLTRTIVQDMPVFPGDKEVKLYQYRWIAENGYTIYQLESGTHIGTHIDGPLHLLEGSEFISQIPIDRLVGRGVLVDAREMREITLSPQNQPRIRQDDIVLFLTGHGKTFGQPDYFSNYPTLAPACADFLVNARVKMVGLDTPSPDAFPFPLHKQFFSANVLIAENLTGLETLVGVEDFEVYALPLKIQADSAFARVIAKIL